jgi:glycosyltransferase involved in cell wall biosynthesis
MTMQNKAHAALTDRSCMDLKPLTLFLSFPTLPLTDHLPSGDGLLAFKFIEYLAARGHRIRVATPLADLRNPLPSTVRIIEMNSRANQPRPGALAYMRWTRKVLREVSAEEKVDLIHELNPVFSLRSLAFAGCGVPVVLGPYSSRWPYPAGGSAASRISRRLKTIVKNFIVGLQQRFAAAVLLSTPAALNNVQDPEAILGRMFLLPPGLDVERFSPAGPAPDAPTVLFLANICLRKGIFDLIEAFELVNRRLPAARLIVAGGGDELPQVRAQVAASSFSERVEFTGHVNREEVPGMMRRATVYCLPSHGEPFGITAIEAMACGKPLVVTRSGGPAFIVGESGGRSVAIGDREGLADALVDLLSNPELCRSMGTYNRGEAERRYAWPVAGARLERIYASVLGLGNAGDEDRLSAGDIDGWRRLQRADSGAVALRPPAPVGKPGERAYE